MSTKFEEIDSQIQALGPTLIRSVKAAIQKNIGDGELHDYKIVWNQLQDIAGAAIKGALSNKFKDAKITVTKSKSTYPDVKMTYKGFSFAIDVKSNESSKEPWYDIARLDTIEESRLKKFDEEYDLVVKYDSSTKKLLDIYFEPLRHTVGFNDKSGGVKYRPYDGKLRPKSWGDFKTGKVYWKTKKDFIEGIKKSQLYRWKEIGKDISKRINTNEKENFKKLFD